MMMMMMMMIIIIIIIMVCLRNICINTLHKGDDDDDDNNNNNNRATIFLHLPLTLLTKINMSCRVVNFMHLNFSYNKDMQHFLVVLPTITETALQKE